MKDTPEYRAGWNDAVTAILDQSEKRRRGWETIGALLDHAKARAIEASHFSQVCRSLLEPETLRQFNALSTKDDLRRSIDAQLQPLLGELNKRFVDAKKRFDSVPTQASGAEKLAYGWAAHELNRACLVIWSILKNRA